MPVLMNQANSLTIDDIEDIIEQVQHQSSWRRMLLLR